MELMRLLRVTRVTAKQEQMALCEAQLELQEAGKALVLTESPTLYLPSANLHCQGLGADSVPSRITTSYLKLARLARVQPTAFRTQASEGKLRASTVILAPAAESNPNRPIGAVFTPNFRFSWQAAVTVWALNSPCA
ncbi:hypothetical protein EYF80_048810 [Liparis tanakae]|uniref:Uncharacterized protein n=1 Tax=Liparis tanakae TaxID=230148 RepID=A0A4Z2FJ95_9TELE|nr:hypothetical protein EYF80_048810 [Liparis tanakae]